MQFHDDANLSAVFFGSLKELYGPKAQMSSGWKHNLSSTRCTTKQVEITFSNPVESGIFNRRWNPQPIWCSTTKNWTKITTNFERNGICHKETKPNKAPGLDHISAELHKLKGEQLTRNLHALMLKCWQQGTVPQDFKDVLIVPIYKKKETTGTVVTTGGHPCLSLQEKSILKYSRPD